MLRTPMATYWLATAFENLSKNFGQLLKVPQNRSNNAEEVSL